MIVLTFLVNLTGLTSLLLYLVRVVQTGLNWVFGHVFKRSMTKSENVFTFSGTDLRMSVVLQNSAAVVMLVSACCGIETLPFRAGLAALLAVDLGSALLRPLLSFDLDPWIFLGITLILLQYLCEMMQPIHESSFSLQLSKLLEQNFVVVFSLGAVLAFVTHSLRHLNSQVSAMAFLVSLGIKMLIGGCPASYEQGVRESPSWVFTPLTL